MKFARLVIFYRLLMIAIVFAVFGHPTFIEKAHAQDANELQVLTWNVFLKPDLAIPNSDRADRVPGIVAAIERSPADVVVLNEMFSNRLSNRITDALREFGWLATPVMGRIGGTKDDSGVIVFSRLPITAIRTRIFEASSGIDSRARKGVMYVRVVKSINGVANSYHIFATHTQAEIDGSVMVDGGSLEANPSRLARREQFAEIKSFIDAQNIRPNDLVVIAGDLNVDFYDSAEYDRMLTTLDADMGDLPMGRRGFPATYSASRNDFVSGGYEAIYDYVLHSRSHRLPAAATNQIRRFRSPQARTNRRPNGDLSDHFAVLSTFHLVNDLVCRDEASLIDDSLNAAAIAAGFELGGNDIRLLCHTAKRWVHPARCYRSIVDGNIADDGEGAWTKADAIAFCGGNVFIRQRMRCFRDRVAAGSTRNAAIAFCNPSRTHIE